MWKLTLLAQAGRADKDPFRQPEVIWGTAGLAVALLVGAIVIWLVDRWRKKAARIRNSAEELTDYRGMYERGEITEEEYAKLRTRVSGRVKQSPPAPGSAAPTAPVPPTEGSRPAATRRRRPDFPIRPAVQNRQGQADKGSGLRLICGTLIAPVCRSGVLLA